MYDVIDIENDSCTIPWCPEFRVYITSHDIKGEFMKAQDWMDADSARNLAIAQLAEVCAVMGLSWSAAEKKFIIELPDVILSRVTPETTPRIRKTFDITKWGDTGIDETAALPDDFQMPDTGEILDEGQPPKGDQNAED